MPITPGAAEDGPQQENIADQQQQQTDQRDQAHMEQQPADHQNAAQDVGPGGIVRTVFCPLRGDVLEEKAEAEHLPPLAPGLSVLNA